MDSCPYDAMYYRSRESWLDFRIEAEAILSLARLSSASRVLEVGCGSGKLLRRIGQAARLAVGVDLSPSGLHLARRGKAAAVVCGRAESLPFAEGSFDAVISQHLLEHLSEPVDALREWGRVLRPGGVIALATPNAEYPDPAHFHDTAHLSLFTPSTLRAAMEYAGFRVDSLYTLFPYFGRGRLARAASIRLATLARRVPRLSDRGRTIIAAATIRRSESRPVPAAP